MSGNDLWQRGTRYHADAADPGLDGNWLNARNIRCNIVADEPFRPRCVVQRKTVQSVLTTAIRIQFSKNGGAWTYATDATSDVRVTDSPHYTHQSDCIEPLLLSGKILADATNGHYIDEDDGVTGAATWPNAISQVLEPEVNLVARSEDVVTGDIFDLRWVRSNGDVFEHGYDLPMDFIVVDAITDAAEGAGFMGQYAEGEGHLGEYASGKGYLGAYVGGDGAIKRKDN